MKVLHIITSLGSGGAEGMLYRLILTSKNSVEHSVICLNHGGKFVSLLRENNIDVLVLDFKSKSSIKAFFKLLRFSQLKKKQGYKLITSWLYHSDIVAWFIKIFLNFNGLVWNIRYTNLQLGRPSVKRWLTLKLLSILSYLKVNSIISCSKSASEIHKKNGYNKKLFEIIPNGYFISKSKKFKRNLKKYEGIYKICMIARWHPQKDFENLFQSLSFLKINKVNFHLTLAGSKIESNNFELINLIKKYNLIKYCSLLGEVDELDDIYSNSHISILSSAYGEGFPNVLVESMLNYTPCISTDVGDAALILSNVGYIVPIKNSKALANALIENYEVLINKHEKYLLKCLHGFDKAISNYDINEIANRYINVWRRIE